MFDKVSLSAEKLATNVSRRAFLGLLGQGALATAGVVGAMLAFGGEAKAITIGGQLPHPCPENYFRCYPGTPRQHCCKLGYKCDGFGCSKP
jgi:hypothetical protein